MLDDLAKVVDEVLSDHPEAVIILISADPENFEKSKKEQSKKPARQKLIEMDFVNYINGFGFDYSVGGSSGGGGSSADAILAENPNP